MKKKTIIISGIAAVLVIGSVVFCFAVKGDGTQPAEVTQTVTEAVATPTIEVTQETTEETSSEVSEPEVEETEVVEEVPEVEVQETSEEVSSIVDVAETSEEVSKDAGVSTQKEEVSQVAEPEPEEVKPAETKPVQAQPAETKPEPNVNQISTDEASQALIAQLKADGAIWGDTPATSTLGDYVPSADVAAAASQIIVE